MTARMCRDCGGAFLGGGWPGDEDEQAGDPVSGLCQECLEDGLRVLAAGRQRPIDPHEDPWWRPELDGAR